MARPDPTGAGALIRLGWIPDPPDSPLRLFPALLPPRQLAVNPTDMWSMHVVGRPGFGKSVFLGNLALQFHAAGEGVLLLDVKGELARAVASRARRLDRLIYVAPHQALAHDHYWSLNPLAFDRSDRERFEFYANALPVIFERIGGYNPELMQRIRKTLSSAVRLALSSRQACFGDVYFILHNEQFRETLLGRPHVHPYAWDYWKNEFAAMSRRDQRMAIDSTDSRVRAILDPTYLNYALNQVETTLDIARWLDAGQLVVVNLDQGRLGIDTARAFANLLLGSLVNEIVQRPQGQTARPWRLIVDEATELTTEPFAEQIEQMRTYAVYPVFSHQSWEQLDEPRNHKLRRAARQADVSVRLNLSRFDAATLRRLERPPEGDTDQAEADELDLYTATVAFARRPPGTAKEQTIRLYPFLDPEIPGQLEAAEAKQLKLTRPARSLRYLYKDGKAKCLVRRQGKGSPDAVEAAPSAHPLQPDPGPDPRDGPDSAGVSDAGRPAPVSLSDLVAGGQTAVSGPAQPGRQNSRPRSGPQSRQRTVPEAAEGSPPGRGAAGDAASRPLVEETGVQRPDPERPSAPERPPQHPWGESS